jgi:hypothetical protein
MGTAFSPSDDWPAARPAVKHKRRNSPDDAGRTTLGQHRKLAFFQKYDKKTELRSYVGLIVLRRGNDRNSTEVTFG